MKKEAHPETVQAADVRCLYKIGEKKAKYLSNLGIRTVYELLHHYPLRYEDRRKIFKISGAPIGEAVCICGQVLTFEKRLLPRKKSMVRIMIQEEGALAELIVFNNLFVLERLKAGRTLIAYGLTEESNGHLKMVSPEIDWDQFGKKTGRIYPVYPLTKGIVNDEIIRWQEEALTLFRSQGAEDYLSAEMRSDYRLCTLTQALEHIHFPKRKTDIGIAKYRLIFDEFFLLRLGLSVIKNRQRSEQGIAFTIHREKIEQLKQSLPFGLTGAQERVSEEIFQDLALKLPMQRLVQGDVGSGKTVIALLAIYNVALNGFQSVLMAPTEILAKQHYESARAMFSSTLLHIDLLVGSMSKKEKEAVYERIRSGTCDVLIGTHAVLEEKVCFEKLGLLITDEQHRFGVRQRSVLMRRSDQTPDMLVMTATPIPRTMAFVIHGDLDISLIDEMPKGRIPIVTQAVPKSKAQKAYDFAISEIQKGRQVYMVCPLIAESEKLDIEAAENIYRQMRESVLKDDRVALLHGKMKAKEKQEVMERFSAGTIDMLVSTTVIEVGINVPNASMMVIQDAQRFGLSQLHQLRGRVGRGSYQSYCILLYDGKGANTKERMKIMCSSNDGFEISEKDLELRGAGELLGTRQHGQLRFKLADIARHHELIRLSGELVAKILENDRKLESVEYRALHSETKIRFNHGEEVLIN